MCPYAAKNAIVVVRHIKSKFSKLTLLEDLLEEIHDKIGKYELCYTIHMKVYGYVQTYRY